MAVPTVPGVIVTCTAGARVYKLEFIAVIADSGTLGRVEHIVESTESMLSSACKYSGCGFMKLLDSGQPWKG